MNTEKLYLIAQTTIGTKLESKGQIFRVTEIKKDAFRGVIEYKGKDRGDVYLSFSTILNPHYGDIKIVE